MMKHNNVWFKNRRAKWRKQQREEQERHRRIQDERPSRTVDPSEGPHSPGLMAKLNPSGLSSSDYRNTSDASGLLNT
ncbi:hypothetical protein CDAR_28151 [Caerostris darwini]|uniref:Homeobox domain-containing protein n=1 Tax=Caerostris darwini TaxID=1538125 RepID=A0AAV4VD49_9ARAC|nr:hypothetical protein CDAR_28151 [Caerostris darwini]